MVSLLKNYKSFRSLSLCIDKKIKVGRITENFFYWWQYTERDLLAIKYAPLKVRSFSVDRRSDSRINFIQPKHPIDAS